MKHFTKEELLQEIAAGNRTLKGLGAKFGLSPDSMKHALAKLEINLKEMRQAPITMNNLAAPVDNEWDQLYKDYDLEGIIGNVAQYMIAQCRIRYCMTAAGARQYMKDNFHYQTMEIRLSK